MKRTAIETLLNIVFWVATAWLITSGFSIQSQERELINGVEKIKTIHNETLVIKLLTCIGIAFVMFYINLWNIGRLAMQQKKEQVFLITAFIFIAAFSVFYLVEKLTLTGARLPLPPALSIGILVFYFTISSTYALGKLWLKTEKKRQQLLLGKKQAELNLLRNQLQPHFLFNALNNLLSMVDQQRSPQLASSIERLSKLLRYVVDETQSQHVTVKQEIEFIRNYTQLQMLRFETGEVDFRLDIKGSHDNQLIEAGLFIPFVENAFKYGTEPEQKTAIDVQFDISRQDEVQFTIKNSIAGFQQNNESAGTGIDATRERLKLVYPGKHGLVITKEDFFAVQLKLNTR